MFNGGRTRQLVGKLAERFAHVSAVLPDLGSIGRGCFVSSFTQQQVRENSTWQFDDSIVIPSGIDRRMLALPPAPAGRPWEWKIGYLGRFDPRKGTETLLRALPLLPSEATLFMYGRGGGEERQRLTRLADQLGVLERVSFGALDRSELAQTYRSLDCVIFPSEWPEPFGLVPLEAMECGIPVVATGVGGSKDFLTDGANCLYFEPGDSQCLALTVTRLATDPDLRARLVQEGRRTAANYDVDFMADRYEREFAAAAGPTSNP
jgi:glycosyltransferase involved in cell wall biosynthesis